MKHTDRIRKRDHILGFLAGAGISLCATMAAVGAFIDFASKRGIP